MAATLTTTPVRTLVRVFSFGYLWHDNDYPRREVGDRCDLLVDLRRLLHNPHDDPAMRELTGLAPQVQEHVLATRGARDLVTATAATASAAVFSLRQVDRTGDLVSVGFGCAGGRHRSVVLATEVCHLLNRLDIGAEVTHYDVHRPVYQHPAILDRCAGGA